jgi:TonB-linked SusC/RagA family outer membrane protein
MARRLKWSFCTLLAVVTMPAWAAAQGPATVTGTVTSEVGKPLAAAQVFVEGLGIGTVTRDNGAYGFTIPASRVQGQPVTIAARLVGYRAASARVTLRPGTITENFVLASAPVTLGAVVVTGAGTLTSAEKLGTARASVDSSLIRRANEPNLVNALAGKAPNVQVLSSSGEPGASSYIQIRGLTSIAASDGQPLFVVDGVPIDNSAQDTPQAPGGANGGTMTSNRALDLNPNDIENIEILKGPSAGAIYGSRAGQGVILITTKRGRAGETRYSLRSSASFDTHGQLPDLQTTYGLGASGVAPACYLEQALGCTFGRAASGSWGPLLPAGTPTFDHAGEMFRTGHLFDNTLSLSGGSDRTLFYLSGASTNQQGFITGPHNKLNRYSVRFNGSQRATGALQFSVNGSYANTQGGFVQSRNNTAGLLLGAWRSPPDFNNLPYLDPVTGLHRSYRYPFPAPGSDQVSRIYDNPFFVANVPEATSNVGRAFGSVSADYTPVSWFRANYQLGSDFSNDNRLEALPWSSSGGAVPGTGYVVQASLRSTSINSLLTATGDYHVSDNFHGSITLGNELNSRSQRTFAVVGTSLIAAEPYSLRNTNSQSPPSDSNTTVRLRSFFGQVSADLWEQLYLTGAIRNDAASVFGPEKHSAWFPKFSAAWNVLRIGSLSELPHVSTAKLRIAYGQSGTQPPPYLLQTVYASGNFLDGGFGPLLTSQQNGLGGLFTSTQLGNPALGPERVRETEGGIDLGLFGDRAMFGFTMYNQKTTDAVLIFPVPATTGFLTQARNAGQLQNKGLELTLDLTPWHRGDVNWTVGFQYSRNRNRVLSLQGANQVVLNAPFGVGSFPQAIVREGQPVGIWLSDDFVRCGRGVPLNGVNLDQTPGECLGAPAGALYIDASGFPVKDQTNQYLVADPNPRWLGGARTTLTWRKLSLGGVLDIRRGGDVYNGTRGALAYFGKTQETVQFRTGTHQFGNGDYLGDQAVAGPGVGKQVTIGQGWYQNNGGVFNGPQAQFFEDGSFVKLRELSVAYNLDVPVSQQRFGFSSVEVRVAGRNLRTWTDYTGVDPETSVGNAQFSPIRGVDYFNNPQTRSLVISLSLSH